MMLSQLPVLLEPSEVASQGVKPGSLFLVHSVQDAQQSWWCVRKEPGQVG